MVTFQWIGLDYITVSMYTEKIDKFNVGELAKILGNAGDIPSGGGHPGAAGFQCGWEYFRSLIENPIQLKDVKDGPATRNSEEGDKA
jgi:nanoRNase/pAp phosphatase (c-di-AMP/oligoRNAs hydrolase)